MTKASVRLTGPRVVTLAYDGLCTFEVGVVIEVFALPRPEMGRDWYRHNIAGIEPGPLRAAGGLMVTVDGSLSLLKGADLIVIPGCSAHARVQTPEPLARLGTGAASGRSIHCGPGPPRWHEPTAGIVHAGPRLSGRCAGRP